MQWIQKNTTVAERRRIYLHLVDASDGITPETGEAAGQAQLSTNGGAFANTTATLTAIGNGAYYVELTQAESNFDGFGIVRYKSAATAEFQNLFQVVNLNPYDSLRLGLSALPAAAAGVSGGMPTLDASLRVAADAAAISGDATAADNLELFFDGTGYSAANSSVGTKSDALVQISGSVSDAAPTSASFKGTSGLSSTDAFYNGMVIVLTSGTLAGLARRIKSYSGATRTLTLENPLPAAPANGNNFSLVSLEVMPAPKGGPGVR